MGLLRRFIRHDLAELHGKQRARAHHRRARRLDPDIRAAAGGGRGAHARQRRPDAGGRLQLRRPPGDRARGASARRRGGGRAARPNEITAETLGGFLDAPDLPDPDLIIRTSGEQRLSNFLLWQAAYSELVFVPTHWPDFDRATLEQALAEYRRRERRFGGLVARTGS